MSNQIKELLNKADAAEAAGDLDATLKLLRKAFILNPKDIGLRERIAETTAQTGQIDQAIRSFRLIAAYHAAAGEHLRAIAACERILELDPRHTDTVDALARLYALRSGPGAAVEPPPSVVAARGPTPRVDTRGPTISTVFGLGGEVSGEQVQGTDTAVSDVPPIPLFSRLSPEAFVSVISRLRRTTRRAGERVVSEGEFGSAMYIVVRGELNVVREDPEANESVVATLSPGDFFGEMSLLAAAPRLASVIVVSDCLLLELDRERLAVITEQHPAVRDVIALHFRTRLAENLIRSSPIFQAFPAPAKTFFIQHCEMMTAPHAMTLLQQGGAGDAMYTILRGSCEVHHQHADGRTEKYRDMYEGDIFGEISLLLNQPCTATVRTRTQCTLLKVSRAVFQHLTSHHPEVETAMTRLTEQRLQRTANLVKCLV